MQGLELPAPPLVAETELLPACEQPPSPPTPPGPAHQFPEPEDTTGQARRRATTGSGTRVDPRVLCSVVSASSLSTTGSTILSTSSAGTQVGVLFTNLLYGMDNLYRRYNRRWRWNLVCRLCCYVIRMYVGLSPCMYL